MSSEGKDKLRLVLENPGDIESAAAIIAASRRLSEQDYIRPEPTNSISQVELGAAALEGLLTALLRVCAARTGVSEEVRKQAESMIDQLKTLDDQGHPEGGITQL